MQNELDTFNNTIKYLSIDIRYSLSQLADYYKKNIEEIRLRNNNPLSIYLKGRDYFIGSDGQIKKSFENAIIVNQQQINNTFQLITNHSIYDYSEEIKNGFITIQGGHRVGIGGKIIYNLTGIESIKNISSLNIRIAREKKEISNHI